MAGEHLFRSSLRDFVDELFDGYLDWEATENHARREAKWATNGESLACLISIKSRGWLKQRIKSARRCTKRLVSVRFEVRRNTRRGDGSSLQL